MFMHCPHREQTRAHAADRALMLTERALMLTVMISAYRVSDVSAL